MGRKCKDIKEIQERIARAICAVMAIFIISLFLISGEKAIMYNTGIVLCILCIINFFIDIFFMVKDRNKKIIIVKMFRII